MFLWHAWYLGEITWDALDRSHEVLHFESIGNKKCAKREVTPCSLGINKSTFHRVPQNQIELKMLQSSAFEDEYIDSPAASWAPCETCTSSAQTATRTSFFFCSLIVSVLSLSMQNNILSLKGTYALDATVQDEVLFQWCLTRAVGFQRLVSFSRCYIGRSFLNFLDRRNSNALCTVYRIHTHRCE